MGRRYRMNRRVPVGVSLLVFSMTPIVSFCNVEFSQICLWICCEPKMPMVSDIGFRMRWCCSIPFTSRAFKTERPFMHLQCCCKGKWQLAKLWLTDELSKPATAYEHASFVNKVWRLQVDVLVSGGGGYTDFRLCGSNRSSNLRSAVYFACLSGRSYLFPGNRSIPGLTQNYFGCTLCLTLGFKYIISGSSEISAGAQHWILRRTKQENMPLFFMFGKRSS